MSEAQEQAGRDLADYIRTLEKSGSFFDPLDGSHWGEFEDYQRRD